MISAATQSGVRFFIHLPIIEVTKSFELFQIFVLPVFSASGNFGLHYATLPEFLAIRDDRQIFMELTEAEVLSYQGRAGSVCPPSKAIYRKNLRKTYAMALFLQDPAKKKEECNQMMGEWRGPEAVYLGHRRWAVSLHRPRSLIMLCSDQAGTRKLPKAELPAIGLVKIPAGCSIQTEECILQTSRRNFFSQTKKKTTQAKDPDRL